METDSLNSLVSGAIWRAEQLEAHGIGSASQAWSGVSSLEGELAKVLSVSESEGRIARRGAVRAALKAGDYARAVALASISTPCSEGPFSQGAPAKPVPIALRVKFSVSHIQF